MKSVGDKEILEFFDNQIIGPDGMAGLPPVSPAGQPPVPPVNPPVPQVPPVPPNVPDNQVIPNVDEIKDKAKATRSMILLNNINNALRFYLMGEEDLMVKENLIKRIQSMVNELADLLGSL